jgi:hypothetical protein
MTDLLYAFALAPGDASFASPPAGFERGAVEFRREAGSTAVVQPIEAGYLAEIEKRTADSDAAWLTERLLDHERVVEACLGEAAVFPFGFGVIFEDEAALASCLAANRERLAGYFARVEGCREWGVKIRGIVEEPSRRELTQAAASGTAYLAARREQPRRLADRRRAMESEAEALVSRWSGFAKDVVARDHGGAASGVIANLAFLVGEDRREAFLQAIETDAAVAERQRIDIVVSGPWAPYSFRVTLAGFPAGMLDARRTAPADADRG